MSMTREAMLEALGMPIFDHEHPPEFVWPCGRRRAHGPHRADELDEQEKGVNHNGDGVIQEYHPAIAYDCPGVKAHPATQIGGRLSHG
jgi:hypothetical protein